MRGPPTSTSFPYATLVRSYEDARIAEVRDTPSLTLIDTAVPPTIRTSPNRKVITLVGFMLGAVVGLAVAYLGELRRSDRKSTRLNSSHAHISYAVFCLKKK